MDTRQRSPVGDWRLLKVLWPYAQRQQQLLWLSLAFLPPLALADAVQLLILQRAIDGPIARASQGSFTLSEAQVQAFMSDRLYSDIHTAANSPGELRGQILP